MPVTSLPVCARSFSTKNRAKGTMYLSPMAFIIRDSGVKFSMLPANSSLRIAGENPLMSTVPSSRNVAGCCADLTSTLQNTIVGGVRPNAWYLALMTSRLRVLPQLLNSMSDTMSTIFGRFSIDSLWGCPS